MAIQVNKKTVDVKSADDTPLVYVLRDELGLHGPRFGCGLGQCGACTVHVGDRAVRSWTGLPDMTDMWTFIRGTDETGLRARSLPPAIPTVRWPAPRPRRAPRSKVR